MVVVGVDPGNRETAVVARDGRDLLAFATLVRKDVGGLPGAAYLNAVADLVATTLASVGPDVMVAVEGVVQPSGFAKGKASSISWLGLLGTAMVLGAVLTVYPAAVVVAPGGNGSAPLIAYPEALRPTRGSGRGFDNLQHTRSAYDVAGAGAMAARLVGA